MPKLRQVLLAGLFVPIIFALGCGSKTSSKNDIGLVIDGSSEQSFNQSTASMVDKLNASDRERFMLAVMGVMMRNEMGGAFGAKNPDAFKKYHGMTPGQFIEYTEKNGEAAKPKGSN